MANRPANNRWVVHMTWRDLLFAHWPVPAKALRPHVPAQMEIDEFDGTAWLAVVPFEMTGIYLRALPPIPGTSRTLELNVRTYVRVSGAQGVYFFSLDAESWPLVVQARAVYHLNYLQASMSIERSGDRIRYSSQRAHRGAAPAVFRGSYGPVGSPYFAERGSLEYWLTERYSLFTTDGRDRVYRGNIHHERWPLQRAEAEFECNSMAEPIGITRLGERPLLHFAKALDVVAWWPTRKLK